MTLSKYRPEMSVEYYIRECIKNIFDEYDFYESYDIDHFIYNALRVIPKNRTSIRNKSIAAACIYNTSGICGQYRSDKIPILTQRQITKVCGINDVTLRKTMSRLIK